MSRKENDKIIEAYIDEIVELGGNIKSLYEENNFNDMPEDEVIAVLEEKIKDLQESIDADIEDRVAFQKQNWPSL